MTNQADKAALFQRLHTESPILVLPNAWDAASALVLQDVGAQAVGTTSGGVAYTLGLPDGEAITRDAMLEAVARIAGCLSIPVTADVEAGYGPNPEDVGATVRGVIDAGGVGVNLEDSVKTAEGVSLREVDDMAARIRAAKDAADKAGIPLVINARTDVFLFGIGERDSRPGHAIERANAYREAGASSLFVPGIKNADVIAQLVEGINGPVNILAQPGSPTVPELDRLGVARVSIGTGLAHSALGHTRRAAKELLESGTYDAMFQGSPTYQDINALMTAPKG